MKSTLLFFLLALHLALAAQIPTTARSEKAVKNCKTRLAGEFQKCGLKLGAPVFIRIFKESSEFEVWVKNGDKYKLFKTYEICYFSGTLGSKTKKGDGQSPEGFYSIAPSHLNPASSYHLSFNIGYPNAYERSKGYTGSAIMVHGNCVSIGCYAMTDPVIEEIWTILYNAFEGKQANIPLHIFPFRMSKDKLEVHKENSWYNYWLHELKPGYDYFEKSKTPPKVSVKDKRYVVVEVK